jgi:hypothetical protein
MALPPRSGVDILSHLPCLIAGGYLPLLSRKMARTPCLTTETSWWCRRIRERVIIAVSRTHHHRVEHKKVQNLQTPNKYYIILYCTYYILYPSENLSLSLVFLDRKNPCGLKPGRGKRQGRFGIPFIIFNICYLLILRVDGGCILRRPTFGIWENCI